MKIIFFLIVLGAGFANAQTNELVTVHTKKQYKALVKEIPAQRLIDVKTIHPSIRLNLKYTGTDNFTKTNLYGKATTTYLLQPAAVAFKKVCDSLAKMNLYVKIWDAYRPHNATKLMWELIQDERYVANPKSGSNHNRGLALDITLVDALGVAKDMGTDFDNFTDTAHHTFTNLPATVLAHRKLLKGLMEYFGFKSLETEWWHYSYATKEKMKIFDFDFALLKKIIW